MQIDRTLLTEKQRNELDMWTDLFHGPAWTAITERYSPIIEALQAKYHNVQGEQALGHLQGSLKTLYAILIHLPDQIHTEFLLATGQLQEVLEQEGSDDDPVTPHDWKV